MTRILAGLLLLLIGVALGLVLSLPIPLRGGPCPRPLPTIQQVQLLAMLVTLRVQVSEVQETRIRGYTGGITAALLVKGEVTVGVDLSQARLESVDAGTRTAVLVLPAPARSGPRLDHERTRLVALSTRGLWMLVPGEGGRGAVLSRAYIEAQERVAEVAADPKLIERARRQAEDVLVAFFGALDWQVTIRWSG